MKNKIQIIGDELYYKLEPVGKLNPFLMSVEMDEFKRFLATGLQKIEQLEDENNNLKRKLKEIGCE